MVEFEHVSMINDIGAATANLSQARSNILLQVFFTGCFFLVCIETLNLGKNQALVALTRA